MSGQWKVWRMQDVGWLNDTTNLWINFDSSKVFFCTFFKFGKILKYYLFNKVLIYKTDNHRHLFEQGLFLCIARQVPHNWANEIDSQAPL